MACQEISVKQGVAMIVMFILGTTFLVFPGIEAKQDVWISYLFSIGLSAVLVCMYARMMSHIPGKDFFAILENMLGRPLAVLFFSIMAIYLFQHLSYVLRHFSDYINAAGLPGTPIIVSMISIGLLAALGVLYGIEILGKWSEWFLIIVGASIIVAALLLTRNMNPDNLRPTLESGIAPIASATWALISFPFSQLVAFLFILPPARNRREPYRIFTLGLLIGGVLIFITSMSNVLVQGVKSMTRLLYPTYSTLSIIRIGTFIQRLEIAATTIFMVVAFLKAAVLLLGFVRSLAKILNLRSYSFIVFPVALLAISYGFNYHRGSLELNAGFYMHWRYYSIIFQVIIPILLFILLEWKAARQRHGQQALSSGPAAGAMDDIG